MCVDMAEKFRFKVARIGQNMIESVRCLCSIADPEHRTRLLSSLRESLVGQGAASSVHGKEVEPQPSGSAVTVAAPADNSAPDATPEHSAWGGWMSQDAAQQDEAGEDSMESKYFRFLLWCS